ncbi:MAG: cytochrome c oxidase subunit 3 [Bacteroidia bacterium]|jgi:cytochrome c oxidase subunit 3|nr:cytochrome c oxidase subunit 3 [Bacteroidia bacterium]
MANVSVDPKALVEGERPIFNASWGKLMMWFFLVSDAFTFSALLVAYAAIRSRTVDGGLAWANPEQVFIHTPILHEVFHIDWPLVFVGLMTFILILSSVTMVLAVEAGHRNSRKEVSKWVAWTIVGGVAFLSCQAYEWYHFIHGSESGAYVLKSGMLDDQNIPGVKKGAAVEVFAVRNVEGEIVQLQTREGSQITYAPALEAVIKASEAHTEGHAAGGGHGEHQEGRTHGGASLKSNEYGPAPFANFFFFVTGFHGTHVASGVVLLIMLLVNVNKGIYDKRGHYEMTEKIGLYWHFVDLVWVFVFTFFYLV